MKTRHTVLNGETCDHCSRAAVVRIDTFGMPDALFACATHYVERFARPLLAMADATMGRIEEELVRLRRGA